MRKSRWLGALAIAFFARVGLAGTVTIGTGGAVEAYPGQHVVLDVTVSASELPTLDHLSLAALSPARFSFSEDFLQQSAAVVNDMPKWYWEPCFRFIEASSVGQYANPVVVGSFEFPEGWLSLDELISVGGTVSLGDRREDVSGAVTIHIVPEPSDGILLGFGLILLVWQRRARSAYA